jgi:hypothetical protein
MPDDLREFYASSNGDRWSLSRDNATQSIYVVHRANEPSGGKTTHFELGAFLVEGRGSPERAALLQLIGTLIIESGAAKESITRP